MKLAFVCDKSWGDLDGASNTRRHCGQCDRDVFNLSGMTRERAATLIAQHQNGLCVHFVSRDGQIVHDGDPLAQLNSQRRGVRRLLAGALMVQSAFLAFADDPAEAFFDPFRAAAELLTPEPVEEKFTTGAMPIPDNIVF